MMAEPSARFGRTRLDPDHAKVTQRGRCRADRPTGRAGGPTSRRPRPTLPSDPLADPAQESLRRPGRRVRAELGRAGQGAWRGWRAGWQPETADRHPPAQDLVGAEPETPAQGGT